MLSALFHSEVYVPEVAKAPLHEGPLQYSRHALSEASSDKYGHISLPAEFSSAGAELIEAEVLLGSQEVVKQVWRQPLDSSRDLVLVIAKGGRVKTVWVNLADDLHLTLNVAKYTSRKRWRSIRKGPAR